MPGIKLKSVSIWLGFLLSFVFAGLSLYKVEWAETLDALRRIRWTDLIIAFILMWAGFLWRTLRWRRLINVGLPGGRRIPLKTCFTVIIIGYMANNILPARIGEVARAYLLSRKLGVPKSYSLGTIVTERLADVLMLVLLISLTLLLLPLPAESKRIATSGAVVGFAAALGLVGAVIWRERVKALLTALLHRLRLGAQADRLVTMADRFLAGVSCGNSWRTLTLVGFDSLGIWVFGQIMMWYVARACNLPIGGVEVLYVMCVVNLSAMLPSGPGYVGSYQFFCVFSLSAFHIDKEPALAFSFVSHIVWYLPLTIVGLLLFVRERLGFGQLASAEITSERRAEGTLTA